MREADMMSTDFPFNCLVCVNEMDAGVVESCGKFDRVLPPGCHFICYPYQILKAHVSLKIQQLEVVCETKTKDNVFISVVVVGINAYELCIYLWMFNSIFILHSYESLLTIVQYRVVKGKVPSAHYKLTDPASQIRSYVFDVVRSSLPRMDLDDAFASKNDLAEAVQNQLQALMKNYGYEIIAALVVDLDPNIRVKAAMNEINGKTRI